MNGGATIRLAFPARTEYLILARLALAGISRSVPMSQETLADLKLAVTEACGNVVRHAYPGGRGSVRVEFDVAPTAIRVSIVDEGLGVRGQIRDSAEGGDLPEGGMGLAIIKAIVDGFSVETGDGGGTVVTIRKRLGTDATEPTRSGP